MENKIETYLNKKVNSIGGITRKYVSPGHIGVADRLVFLPEGCLVLVEVKTKTGKESPWQKRERNKMLSLGFTSVIVYGKEDVDRLINALS